MAETVAAEILNCPEPNPGPASPGHAGAGLFRRDSLLERWVRISCMTKVPDFDSERGFQDQHGIPSPDDTLPTPDVVDDTRTNSSVGAHLDLDPEAVQIVAQESSWDDLEPRTDEHWHLVDIEMRELGVRPEW